MPDPRTEPRSPLQLVKALGEQAIFAAGDRVRVSTRYPVGHYRVPIYIRGKEGVVELVIEPTAVNNEEEGFGRNAGTRRHYYRVAILLRDLWAEYAGSAHDSVRIEVFESWLEKV